MNYLKIILFLSIGFFSCSGPSCDCDLLFMDDDSLMNISASKDLEAQKLMAKRYDLKNQFKKLKLKIKLKKKSGGYIDDEFTYKKLIGDLAVLKQEEMRTLQKFYILTQYSLNREEDEKIIPFTGSCFKLGAKGEVIYEAEYEDGKLISEEWLNKNQRYIKNDR